jgi:glycosyltransferase involved in cell wall biosynthesis
VKVGIDVTATTVGGTGVARYAHALTAALAAAGVDTTLFAIGRGPLDPPPSTRRLRLPLRVAYAGWRLLGAPRAEWLAPGVDVVHALDMTPPPTRLPVVMTVHDLAALDLPHLHSDRHQHQQRHQLLAARRSAAVCAVSRSTADALVRHGVAADRIVVTPLGLIPLPPPEDRAVVGPYLLAVGEVTARKGQAELVDAFVRADLPADWRLVVAGPADPDSTADPIAPHPRVLRVGPVSDARLSTLYAHAEALCFPTFAEGFGLPVLEAMSFALPVLATDLPVVREVAGDVATYVPAGDVDAWQQALTALARDPDAARSRAAGGPARAAGFSWERTARATVDAYRLALRCG